MNRINPIENYVDSTFGKKLALTFKYNPHSRHVFFNPVNLTKGYRGADEQLCKSYSFRGGRGYADQFGFHRDCSERE